MFQGCLGPAYSITRIQRPVLSVSTPLDMAHVAHWVRASAISQPLAVGQAYCSLTTSMKFGMPTCLLHLLVLMALQRTQLSRMVSATASKCRTGTIFNTYGGDYADAVLGFLCGTADISGYRTQPIVEGMPVGRGTLEA
jgi:hypothetical protein